MSEKYSIALAIHTAHRKVFDNILFIFELRKNDSNLQYTSVPIRMLISSSTVTQQSIHSVYVYSVLFNSSGDWLSY
jgi:hypothetical protein